MNSTFQIIVQGGIKYTHKIPVGDYNVLELLEWLNEQISDKLTVEYSTSLNKLEYL